MNYHNIAIMWVWVFGGVTDLMVIGNPFLENKTLLKLTGIPVILGLILATFLVGGGI